MKFFNRSPKFCAICQKELKHKHRPKKEWNIEGLLCGDCHMDKMRQYFEKLLICGNHAGSGKWKDYFVRVVLIKKKKTLTKKKNFVVFAVQN
jgi:hypothetical protein